MPLDVKAACLALAAKLSDKTTYGLTAGIDPETLSPPCVWIQPREVRDFRLGGGGTLVAWCYVIATNTDTPNAMSLLDDMLDAVIEVAGIAESDRTIDLAAALTLPSSPSTVLPAYRVAVDLEME